MGETENTNLELSQEEKQSFELNDLKDLLGKLKSSDGTINLKKEIAELDKNEWELEISEAEEKLLEKLESLAKEWKSIESWIIIIESIIEDLDWLKLNSVKEEDESEKRKPWYDDIETYIRSNVLYELSNNYIDPKDIDKQDRYDNIWVEKSDNQKVNPEILNWIDSLNLNEIKKLIDFFSKDILCDNNYIIEPLYKKLNNKLIEKESTKLNKNLNNLVQWKIDEAKKQNPTFEKNSEEVTKEIIEKMKDNWCVWDSITLINNILKENELGIIEFDKLTVISEIINSSTIIDRANVEKELFEAENGITNWEIELTEEEKKEKIETLNKKLKELDRVESNALMLSELNEEEFNYMIENLDKVENPQDLMKEVKNRYEKRKELEEIDNKVTNEYNLNSFTQNKDNQYNIEVNWNPISGLSKEEIESIWIIKDENWEITIKNPEALKNIVDFKEKMDLLNLTDSVWENRHFFIKQLKEIKWSNLIDINDNDNINKSELNKLLKFILEIIWEKWSESDINTTYSKIININWAWILNDKTDTITWFSNIWKRLSEKWYLKERSWGALSLVDRIDNIQNKKNWTKQKNTD